MRGDDEIRSRLEVARLLGVPSSGRDVEVHLPTEDRDEAFEQALRDLGAAGR
jgi:hypothetical protein